MNIKSAILSGILVWGLLAAAQVAAHFITLLLPDVDVPANWILSIIMIPLVALGAHIYYRKGHQANGFLLGITMFAVQLALDILITLPAFITPNSVDSSSFLGNSAYWLLAVEYISIVAAYWQIERAVKRTQQ